MAEWSNEAADIAAASAEEELATIPEVQTAALANWWKKWYLMTPEGTQGAGHKRLARVLLRYAD